MKWEYHQGFGRKPPEGQIPREAFFAFAIQKYLVKEELECG
jgi:hypothetical protein